MAILGLTTPLEHDQRGKPVRIGYLQKGRREGFGKGIKLYDENHFIFSPIDTSNTGDQMIAIFKSVYGDEPRSIDDVRIAVDLAGNFNIVDCAWLYARRHTEKGSTLFAVSNGTDIKRMRNEKTGKVDYFYDGERPHNQHTKTDGDGKSCFVYREKLYPWQQEMTVDLILPEFNRALAAAGVGGYGVVTLITHATNDIPGLINEYYGILNELVSLVSNPMELGDGERAKKYLPLRNFPLRLFRSEDKMTTPDYRTKDAGNRLNSTRWLLHWQLNPEFSAAMQEALDSRTRLTLATIAQRPLLAAPANGRSVAELNDSLFGDDNLRQLPAKVKPSADFLNWGDEIEDATKEVEEQPKPEYDWAEQVRAAQTLDAFCYAAYQKLEVSGAFKDSNHIKRGFPKLVGEWPPEDNMTAFIAFEKYANAVADGATAKAAAQAAADWYQGWLAEFDVFDEEE